MNDTVEAIRSMLRPFPAVRLAAKPTPIGPLDRLSRRLDQGLRAWVMRDDLTGFGLGGNKIRKLEYLIGDALARQADTLVVPLASSFSRNAAAAGSAFGLQVHVMVAGEEGQHNRLSRDFFAAVGATLHHVGPSEQLPARQSELVHRLRADGGHVLEWHRGGSDTVGTLGYVEAFAEIAAFMAREGVVFDRILLASGSAATQAGLALGRAIGRCQDVHVIGIAISQPAALQTRRVADLAVETAGSLGMAFDPSTVVVDDRYLGDGYPVPSAASRAAVELLAREEGLVLDPVYAGKAAAALLAQARDGELRAAANVLLIHTGGNGGAFY